LIDADNFRRGLKLKLKTRSSRRVSDGSIGPSGPPAESRSNSATPADRQIIAKVLSQMHLQSERAHIIRP